jgi:hypothetical protein
MSPKTSPNTSLKMSCHVVELAAAEAAVLAVDAGVAEAVVGARFCGSERTE